MVNMLTTMRGNFLDFIRVMFPDGRIVKPSNETSVYADDEAIGIIVSPNCIDVYARVLVGTTPIYIERSHSIRKAGEVLYYAKLYEHSDKDGDVFENRIDETESHDVRVFMQDVRKWVTK